MRLFFILVVALISYSCNSVVKKDDSNAAIKRADTANVVQNFTVNTIPKVEHETVVSQEDSISVTVEDEKILVTIKNNFDQDLSYDAKFFFERLENGKWQKVDYIRNYGIPSIEYILKPSEARTNDFSFKLFYEPLSDGNYRFIKEYCLNDKVKREQIKEFRIIKGHVANVQNNTAAQNSQIKPTEKDLSQADLLSVKLENKSITLDLTNIYDEPIYYYSSITFQKWNGVKWEHINFIDTYIFVSMEYVLLPKDSRTHPFPFTSFATPLSNGRYRAIKSYWFADKVRRETVKEFNIPACYNLCLVFPAVVKRRDLIAQKPIFYSVINSTDDTYITGDRYFLERRNMDGQWDKVKLAVGLVNDIGYKISPQTESSGIKLPTHLLRNLPNGNYRIKKSASEYPSKEEILLRAEFTVTD